MSTIEEQLSHLTAEDDLLNDEDAMAQANAGLALENAQLTLRALVSSKEAGVIIGKAGKNVADLREATNVKAGVSKVVPGVSDRILSVTGTLDGISRAYGMVAQTLIDSPPSAASTSLASPLAAHGLNTTAVSVRLLISHQLMGTIIGRQGLKIKQIQDTSGTRMVASKELLPQSTERIVEVQGTADAIQIAVWEISKCLVEDYERAAGGVPYNPIARLNPANPNAAAPNGVYSPSARLPRSSEYSSDLQNLPTTSSAQPHIDINDPNVRTQNISIPQDMVGCIIGRGGTKITEIRRSSGSRISIAKAPHDETGERMFTIMGTQENNEKALLLLFQQLEAEKLRRSENSD